jgi:hypothetical protein
LALRREKADKKGAERLQKKISFLHYSDPDTDLDPIRIQGFLSYKIKEKNLFLIKNCNLLIPRPP